jgi:hypothetical protein
LGRGYFVIRNAMKRMYGVQTLTCRVFGKADAAIRRICLFFLTA